MLSCPPVERLMQIVMLSALAHKKIALLECAKLFISISWQPGQNITLSFFETGGLLLIFTISVRIRNYYNRNTGEQELGFIVSVDLLFSFNRNLFSVS